MGSPRSRPTALGVTFLILKLSLLLLKRHLKEGRQNRRMGILHTLQSHVSALLFVLQLTSCVLQLNDIYPHQYLIYQAWH